MKKLFLLLALSALALSASAYNDYRGHNLDSLERVVSRWTPDAVDRATDVEIVTKNGERAEQIVLVPKGDPENPLSREDIVNKLKTCANGQADNASLDKLVGRILTIDGEETFRYPMQNA